MGVAAGNRVRNSNSVLTTVDHPDSGLLVAFCRWNSAAAHLAVALGVRRWEGRPLSECPAASPEPRKMMLMRAEKSNIQLQIEFDLMQVAFLDGGAALSAALDVKRWEAGPLSVAGCEPAARSAVRMWSRRTASALLAFVLASHVLRLVV